MTKQTLAQRFEIALEEALDEDSGVSLPFRAERLIEREADLIEALTPEWRLQAVIAGLRKTRLEQSKRLRKTQMVFPELEEQFNRIPKRVPIADGTRVKRGNLTYDDSRK